MCEVFLFCCCNQCICNIKICYCRILDRCVLLGCSFHTDRTCCDYNVTTFNLCLHSATCSNSYKSICSTFIQLFHSDCCRRATDTCRCNAYLYSVQCSCISNILSVICYQNRIIKILCDLNATFWISRHDHITSNFSFCYLNMVLSARIF